MTWRLITIRPSHYNEKARWALDRFELPYEEQPWMPMLHFIGSGAVLLPRRLGRADPQSSRLSTPILVTEDRTLSDSSDIVAFVSSHVGDPARSLYWSNEVVELDRHFSGRLGADTRRVAYHYLLPQQDLLEQLAHHSVGPLQARAWIAISPLVRRGIAKQLHVRADKAARSRERIVAEFDAVGERLADGRRYLCGDRFSAADISFSALASLALLVQPHEGYGAWLPSLDAVPPECAELAQQLRATRAGQFILRMFAEERGRRVLPCPVP
ncbi:MAG TPA: glutathione S-transferase C-terminal domain-containing protein [Enhygromyxa sp.]|nr:glutathione S-transferase C-terminal domain-containing protein [Enhygromyxa sp.]